ncbi:ATP/GTP-binding protein [Streptomyces sp. NPDC057638]|uniref:GTP-binding protein n=1 Tax=Streptomyces sp. NPDC057638 TaxID=3346190 RepID=UPI0036BBD7D5
MDSALCEQVAFVPATVTRSAKILVTGPFAVGKTTLVASVSEIAPMSTEETLTQAGAGTDDLTGAPDKTRTTVAFDFGRLTLTDDLVLYLFGTPGQDRFRPLWQALARGALGALVLVDTRHLERADDTLTAVERLGLPFAVAVNTFDGAVRYPPDAVREALDLPEQVPLTSCDARDRGSAVDALITLVAYLHTLETRS